MDARGKTGRCQRSRQEIAVVNGEADLIAVAGVEIGMRVEECLRFGRGRLGKSVDIMMAVALGVGDADQRAERKVLLHAKARLAGQVLPRDEELLAATAPFL